ICDEVLLTHPYTTTHIQYINFWDRTRNNITLYPKTQIVLGLMNGTRFGAVDPRMSRMLTMDSANTTYRGLDVNATASAPFGALSVAQRPRNFFGYPADTGLGLPSRYIFADRSKILVMTYSELQFIKAEAALRHGATATARSAYINGISSHM